MEQLQVRLHLLDRYVLFVGIVKVKFLSLDESNNEADDSEDVDSDARHFSLDFRIRLKQNDDRIFIQTYKGKK